MKNTRKLLRRYIIVICIILFTSIIIFYFFNIVVFQNKKKALNILVLSSQIDEYEIKNKLEDVLNLSEDEEVTIKYMDISNEINRAIVLTWIRARTVDLMISGNKQLDFFAENAFLMDMKNDIQLKGDNGRKYYYNYIATYDSEGNKINRGEKTEYGIFVKRIMGIDSIDEPILSVVTNCNNKENTVIAIDYFESRK